VAFLLSTPDWLELPQTKFGIRGTLRTLDRYSNRYLPAGFEAPLEGELLPEGLSEGREWEIRTYIHLAIF
jgi:hypothetical protein